jgi:putative DNA primase/helicase
MTDISGSRMNVHVSNGSVNHNSTPAVVSWYVNVLHERGEQAGVPGKFTVVGKSDQGWAARVHHFALGDRTAMAAKIAELSLVYDVGVPLALMRPDLPDYKSGEFEDVVATLGLLLDADEYDQFGEPKAPITAPMTPTIVWRSSPMGKHFIYLLDQPLLDRDEAKQIGLALETMTGEKGSARINLGRRVPGTLNHKRNPKAVVAIVPSEVYAFTELKALRALVEPHIKPLPERKVAAPVKPPSEIEIAKLERAVRFAVEKDPEWFHKRDNRLKTVWGIKRGGYGERGFEAAKLFCSLTPSKKRGHRLERYWFDSDADEGTVTLKSFWQHATDIGFKQTPAEFGEWRNDEVRKSFEGLAQHVARVNSGDAPLTPVGPPAGSYPVPASRDGYKSLTGGGARPQVAVPDYAEMEIADRFVQNYSAQLSYIKSRKQWNYWDGKRWHRDQTGYVADLAARHCRAEAGIAVQTPKITEAIVRSICSDRMRKAVLSLAGDDQRIATLAGDWDSDPWLLGTPDGIVDLRTSTLRAAKPEDRVTKSTSVAPYGDCPTWIAFLARATGGNAELQVYLQRLCGYALTGDASEESLHFNYGPGGGGKGTFSHAIEGILGDYHTVTAIATLTESKHDRHPTELAALQGARLVTCSETERGKQWAESRIKEMTGRDTITARFMGGDFFSYRPTFKILVSGNHKPHLRPDSGIRRRFQLIPFVAKIPESERDPNLGEKLRAEWSGILAWMIAGCALWQRDRLSPPEIVCAATDEYMAEEAEDCLAQWLAECCDGDPTAETASAGLYESYKRYAERSSEKPMSNVLFGKALRAPPLEYTVKKTKRGAVVLGLKLAAPPPPPVPRPP